MLKTNVEIEKDFRADLDILLKKYDAELEITDDGKSYGMHSPIVIISIPSKEDKKGNRIRDYCEFNL